MIEYEVIILDPSPDDAASALNDLAALGWTIVGSYADDRIIISREKPVLGRLGMKSVRVIDQPPTVA